MRRTAGTRVRALRMNVPSVVVPLMVSQMNAFSRHDTAPSLASELTRGRLLSSHESASRNRMSVEMIAIILTAATLLIAWLTYRKSHPRRILCYSLEATPVLAAETPEIKVFVGDREVTRPHVAILAFELVGSNAILYEHFSGGKAMTMRVGSEILNRPDVEGQNLNELAISIDPSGEVKIGPGVIKPGFYGQLRLVTEGEPRVQITQDNLDGVVLVDVVDEKLNVEAADKRVNFRIKVLFGVLFFPVMASATAYQAVLETGRDLVWLEWTPIVLIGLGCVLFCIFVTPAIIANRNIDTVNKHLSRKASYNRKIDGGRMTPKGASRLFLRGKN